jgi:hypothetical protein
MEVGAEVGEVGEVGDVAREGYSNTSTSHSANFSSQSKFAAVTAQLATAHDAKLGLHV